MFTVTSSKFQKDYCKQCIYYKACTKQEQEDCYNVNLKKKEYLAEMIYGQPTKIIDK